MSRWFEFAENVKIHLRQWPVHWWVYREGNRNIKNHLGKDITSGMTQDDRTMMRDLCISEDFTTYDYYPDKLEDHLIEDIQELKDFVNNNWIIRNALTPPTSPKGFKNYYLSHLIDQIRGLKIIHGLIVPSVYSEPPNSIDFITNEEELNEDTQRIC